MLQLCRKDSNFFSANIGYTQPLMIVNNFQILLIGCSFKIVYLQRESTTANHK